MKIHTSCTTLPLYLYIRCHVTGDLSSLIIEGEATEEELKTAWRSIGQEFFDLNEDKKAGYELSLVIAIEALNIQILVIQECVEVLQKYRCDELVEILHKFGYTFPFDINNEQQYLADLKRVLNRAKSLVMQLNEKQAQLKLITKPKDSSTEVTIKYYDKILSILSQFMKYHIDEEKITVSRYAGILNLYMAHCEQLNKQGHE